MPCDERGLDRIPGSYHRPRGAVGPSGQRAQSPSSAATIVKKVEWENESSFHKVIFTRCHILCFPQVAISLHAFCLYF